MDIKEYQEKAERTISPQDKALDRLDTTVHIQIIHSILGMSGEVGELSSALEKYGWYGRELDVLNIKEELGDILWYMAELCQCLNLDLEEIMEMNIRKLQERYPEKYDDNKCKERNYEKEATAMTRSEDKSIKTGRSPSWYNVVIKKSRLDWLKKVRKERAKDDGVNYDA